MRLRRTVVALGLVLLGSASFWRLTRREASPLPSPAAAAAAEAAPAAPLGEAPLCEPSSALPLIADALLIADNEGGPGEDRPLWVGHLEGQLIGVDANLREAQGVPKDVEALARVGDELWVFGSFSRNKDCNPRPARRAARVSRPPLFTGAGVAGAVGRTVRLAEGKAEELAAWDAFESDAAACAARFADPAGAAPVCAAIAEATATSRPGACATFNLEAAVGLPDGSLWVGLRAPLIGQDAILLRVDPQAPDLRFLGWRALPLGGRGLRELSLRGDEVWGIAGEAVELDGQPAGPSALFTLPADALETASPAMIREDLPSNAEGLHVGAADLWLLLDGDAGDKGTRCATPARQLRLPKP